MNNKAICRKSDKHFTSGKEYECTPVYVRYETPMIEIVDDNGELIQVDLNDKDFQFILNENIVYMFGIPLFTYDGWVDVMDDGIQYKVSEWQLIDMEKYNGKYTVVTFDGLLRIYEAEGEKLFNGSLLDSKDFCWKLRNKIK